MPPSIFLSLSFEPIGCSAVCCLIVTYLCVFQIAFDDFRIYSTVVRGHACIVPFLPNALWLFWSSACGWPGDCPVRRLGGVLWGCLLGMLAYSAVYVSCCFVDVLPSSLSIRCRYQCLQLLLLNYSFVFHCLSFFMCFGVLLLGVRYLSNG